MKAKDYNLINTLLAQYSATTADLKTCEAAIQTRQLRAARQLLPRHVQKKTLLGDLEDKLRALAESFAQELFPPTEDRRNHKTPFGEMGFHRSTSLEFRDEESVLGRIRSACAAELHAAAAEQRPPRFTLAQLVRVSEEPNLESLETLEDATLRDFGITRATRDNFKIKPFAMKSDKPARAGTEASAK